MSDMPTLGREYLAHVMINTEESSTFRKGGGRGEGAEEQPIEKDNSSLVNENKQLQSQRKTIKNGHFS